MDIKVYLVILIFVFLANLPFINKNLFYIFPVSYKNIKLYLIEWIFNFIIFLIISFGLESINSKVYHQGRRFYLILLCLYIVFSFPGFIFRYFWKK